MNPQGNFARLDEVAIAMNISPRQFRRLQHHWRARRLMKPGKHYTELGPRCIRYDLNAMLELAIKHGYAGR